MKKQIFCIVVALLLCFLQNAVPAMAGVYVVDESCTVQDGFEPPENETIVHYLNTGAKAYTKIANAVDELWVGEHHRFNVAANRRTKVTIHWYSSDKKVAEIDKVTGELTALSAGTTTITMWDTANKTKHRYELTVKALPVLPEMPQEWYTVEPYEEMFEGEKITGVKLLLKQEYTYLYEQCSMLKIPDEINGEKVRQIRMEGVAGGKYRLAQWGFNNLKMLQCSYEIASCGSYESYSDANGLEEIICLDAPEWLVKKGLKCKKVHIPEGVRLVLTEQFLNDAPKTIRIPASVKALCIDNGMAEGTGILAGGKTDFAVDGNNTNYYSIFGVLFTYPFGQIDYRSNTLRDIWGGDCYYGEAGKNMLLKYPEDRTGSTYRVPEGVERIGSWAFSESQHLKKVILPDSVTEIREGAFTDMKQNVEIVIPASVTVFESGWFGDPFGLYGEADESITKNITIITPKGSAAEAYAIKYGIKYRNEE